MSRVVSDAEFAFRLRNPNLDSPNLEDGFDEPDVESVWGSYGDFRLVGHGKVTNGYCGKFASFWGCLRTDLHNLITLGGVNYADKAFIRRIFNSCDKPSCPVCYKYGWGVREARKIEARLLEASKRFGLAEHIVATVPPKFFHLEHTALRAKVRKILADRKIIGGVMIFHGFRFDKFKRPYWSPHFHVLGYLLGGYPCRSCKKKCFKGCGEFEDIKHRCYEKDGCIVRVLGKRKTVGGTAWYQLHHASYKKNIVRFHVATWFGVVSYHKLKVTAEFKKHVCPICQHDLEKLLYFGTKRSLLMCHGSDMASCDKRDSFEDFLEDGRIVWFERQPKKYGSGSYDD